MKIVAAGKKDALLLFIDSMKKENYLIDTNRLKEVSFWRWMVDKFPKEKDGNIIFIKFPFPIDSLANHFSEPKTYFFAQWQQKEKTFKNGNDYVLMSWTMNDKAIASEKDIYRAYMYRFMNFPTYFIRKENHLFAISHRMGVRAEATRALALRFKNYMGEGALMFGYYNLYEAR